MGKKTKIEWTDATWNPVTGRLHGCDYCYARGIAKRFGCGLLPVSGENLAVLDTPVVDNGKTYPYPFNFLPTFHKYRLNEPARWTKPRTIFVCSMADLFGDWVPDEWIAEVFKACEAAPQHRYLFLTKKPERYRALYEKKALPYFDNFWFGSTVTKASDSYTWFIDTPYHSFVSVEPILEPVGSWDGNPPEWIIVGAETGNRKVKIVPDERWIFDLYTDCRDMGVPLFMKDSLMPIVGERNMIREFPWGR